MKDAGLAVVAFGILPCPLIVLNFQIQKVTA
jgi:hypothetical protein